mmetsp:Transcript_38721/g.97327  ORF Transcript_38721/g.97327 Transcript_38721/m.97327 type:complete len:446 (-) Transcript_38721:560-1897(-)
MLEALLLPPVPLCGPLLDHLLPLVFEDCHLPLPLLLFFLALLRALFLLLPALVLPRLHLEALLHLMLLPLLDHCCKLPVPVLLLRFDVVFSLRRDSGRGVVLLSSELPLSELLIPRLLTGLLHGISSLSDTQGLGGLHVANLHAILVVLLVSRRLSVRDALLPLPVKLSLLLVRDRQLFRLLCFSLFALLQSSLFPRRRQSLLLAELLAQRLNVVQHQHVPRVFFLHIVLRPQVFRLLPSLYFLMFLSQLGCPLGGLLPEVLLLTLLLSSLIRRNLLDLPLSKRKVLALGLLDSLHSLRDSILAFGLHLLLEFLLCRQVCLHCIFLLLFAQPCILQLLGHGSLLLGCRLDELLDRCQVTLSALLFEDLDSILSLLLVLLVPLLPLFGNVLLHLRLLPPLGTLLVNALLPGLRLELLEFPFLLQLGDEGFAVFLALHCNVCSTLLL